MNMKLIMVSGSSCSGCTNLHLEIKEVLSQFPNLVYKEVSIDQKNEETERLIEEYQIERIPTLLLFKDNEELGRVSGYQPAEILQFWLEDKMK